MQTCSPPFCSKSTACFDEEREMQAPSEELDISAPIQNPLRRPPAMCSRIAILSVKIEAVCANSTGQWASKHCISADKPSDR